MTAALRPALPALAGQLPADIDSFTGRHRELAEVTAALGAANASQVVAIHAARGRPGAGVTTLAVRLGHLLADRFPDRQLFVDVSAVSGGWRPASVAQVLAALLTADGVDARFLPADLAGRAAMWQDRLAGRRVLLVLDNATRGDEIMLMLPEPVGCAVLVASRQPLDGLPASSLKVPVDALASDDAMSLFRRLAGRPAGQPAQLAELVELCDRSPLAVCVLARVLASCPWVTGGDLLRAAGPDTAGPELLAGPGEHRSLAAVLALSGQYLSAGQQRFLGYLGLYPGDLDAHAAAALAALPPDTAAEYLGELHRRDLLAEPVSRRYQVPGALREYARDLSARYCAGERHQAIGRLLDYYQHGAEAASGYLPGCTGPPARPAPPAALPPITDRDQAQAWMMAELASLLGCISHASASGWTDRVLGLTAAVAPYLRGRGPWTTAVTLHTAAVTLAGDVSDRLGAAAARHDLGAAMQLTSDYLNASSVLEEALAWYREAGDRAGGARVLAVLGTVRRLTGDYPAAASALDEALGWYRELGDASGEARVLTAQGALRYATRAYPAAALVLEQALAWYRTAGDRSGAAHVLGTLGAVRYKTGDHPGAIAALEGALDIHHDLGSGLGAVNVLNVLEGVCYLTGDLPGAAAAQEQALGMHREMGNRLGEVQSLSHTGGLHLAGRDPQRAQASYQLALKLARAVGSEPEAARALAGLGRCAAAISCA